MTPQELEAVQVQLERETARGAKARSVLENEIYQEAVRLVEEDTLEKWKTSPVRDAEGQLALRLKWQVLQEIVGHLTDVMQTGKMAEEQLIAEGSMFERMREAFRKRRMKG